MVESASGACIAIYQLPASHADLAEPASLLGTLLRLLRTRSVTMGYLRTTEYGVGKSQQQAEAFARDTLRCNSSVQRSGRGRDARAVDDDVPMISVYGVGGAWA